MVKNRTVWAIGLIISFTTMIFSKKLEMKLLYFFTFILFLGFICYERYIKSKGKRELNNNIVMLITVLILSINSAILSFILHDELDTQLNYLFMIALFLYLLYYEKYVKIKKNK